MWMSHVTHVKRVMSRSSTSRVTHMGDSSVSRGTNSNQNWPNLDFRIFRSFAYFFGRAAFLVETVIRVRLMCICDITHQRIRVKHMNQSWYMYESSF